MNLKLIIAASIVGLQALLIWALCVFAVVSILSGDSSSLTSALFLLGLLLAAGLWASNVALGLIRRKRWAHTPAMILQLLTAAIATASFAGEFGSVWIGLGLLIPAALSFYLLFSQSVRSEFGKD
jgi:hypothetical protein